ncbi:MAG: leucine-rich repeat protein, partial [Clostridia bacterium]|nr:leucine-rich repeat protein [Clostridia bacterium]
MSKVVVTKSKLDAINSAISAKTGMSSQRTLDGMATAIGSISGESGALAQYRALTSGTATALEDPTITELVDYAFYRRTNLKKISLPNLTFMGREAFRYCSSLTGFIDCPAPYGQGNGSYFRGALTKTCVLNINCMPVYTLNSCGASHLWLTGYIASCNNFFATDCANLISIQFENVDMIKGDMLEGAVLSHMIIRQTRDVTLSFAFQSPTSSTLTV